MFVDHHRMEFLLSSPEPWTRYCARLDLLGQPADHPQVLAERQAMLEHPAVHSLIAGAITWPGYALQRHNDARHPLHHLSTLADFGLHHADPGLDQAINSILAHQSPRGAFQTLLNIPAAYGGSGQDQWAWVACDAPILLYALLGLGLPPDERLARAVEHLISLAGNNGWGCAAAPELGRFKGPGRRSDPCPIASLYALKALSLLPDLRDMPAVRAGAEMLLSHWEQRREKKYFLFGVGTDFRKLKYPFIWYDILHVLEVLSCYPFLHKDPRLLEMLSVVVAQADSHGCYAAGSMYQAWKGWSFADKKNPSPWLTFLVFRIQARMGVKVV